MSNQLTNSEYIKNNNCYFKILNVLDESNIFRIVEVEQVKNPVDEILCVLSDLENYKVYLDNREYIAQSFFFNDEKKFCCKLLCNISLSSTITMPITRAIFPKLSALDLITTIPLTDSGFVK